MRLAVLMTCSAVTMLGFTTAALGLAWWSNDRGLRMTERLHLAHHSFEAHLSVRAHVANLFKQYSDALLIGDRDGGLGETQLKDEIWSDLSVIRATVADEIDLVGQEESSELDDLALLEATLRRQIIELEQLVALPPAQREVERLARILDEGVDLELAALIDAAIAHEAAEMDATEAQMGMQSTALFRLLVGLVIATVIGTLLLFLVWQRRMAQPLTRLREGVKELSQGNFAHRLAVPGGSEIAEVARVLDEMALRVATREHTLSEQNAALEVAVAERTVELKGLLDQAKEQDETRRQMMADVSHELRTPLTIIMGESEIALRGTEKEPEAYREALTRTHNAATHTAHLVDDLLFMARNEAGRPRLALENFDLRAVTVEAVAMIDKQLHVFSDLLPGPIRADRNRIRQAVFALVQNAKVHGGPKIRIRLLPTLRGYRIQVEDDGAGLTPEDREQAFTRFFRGPNAAETYVEGTGLGLPIVRAIAEAHGGGVWLEERSGGGTVAVLDLPRAPPRTADGP